MSLIRKSSQTKGKPHHIQTSKYGFIPGLNEGTNGNYFVDGTNGNDTNNGNTGATDASNDLGCLMFVKRAQPRAVYTAKGSWTSSANAVSFAVELKSN